MALTEDEEFELLSLERERSMGATPATTVPSPVAKKAPQPSMLEQLKQGYDLGNPVNIAKKAYEGAIGLVNKGGEMAAESLAERGVDPRVAAGVGTAIQMTPEVAMMRPGKAVTSGGSKMLRGTAEAWAQRALGIPKSQLKTPFARGQAAKAAKTALDEGVIPWSGSQEVAAQRARALAEKSGSELGDIRRSVGNQKVDDVFDSLESLRSDVVGGRSGGIWDDISKKIDKAQESVLGLIGKDGAVALDDVEKTKNLLRDSVNYMSDAASQQTTKQTTRAIESGVEKTLAKAGADVARYKTAKQKFGAAKKMLEGLDVSAAANTGNNRFGPTASGGGILSAAMTGNPLTGILSLVGIETAKRRGPGIAANSFNSANTSIAKLIQESGRARSPLLALIGELTARQTISGRR